jgi:hypothetical protein
MPVKDAGFLGCTQYNRDDETWRKPPACEWLDSPERPSGSQPYQPVSRSVPLGASDALVQPTGMTSAMRPRPRLRELDGS